MTPELKSHFVCAKYDHLSSSERKKFTAGCSLQSFISTKSNSFIPLVTEHRRLWSSGWWLSTGRFTSGRSWWRLWTTNWWFWSRSGSTDGWLWFSSRRGFRLSPRRRYRPATHRRSGSRFSLSSIRAPSFRSSILWSPMIIHFRFSNFRRWLLPTSFLHNFILVATSRANFLKSPLSYWISDTFDDIISIIFTCTVTGWTWMSAKVTASGIMSWWFFWPEPAFSHMKTTQKTLKHSLEDLQFFWNKW